MDTTRSFSIFLLITLSCLSFGTSDTLDGKEDPKPRNDPAISDNLRRVINRVDVKSKESHVEGNKDDSRSRSADETPHVKKKPNRKPWRSLAHNEACKNDIANLCTTDHQTNDFMIIDCLERNDLTAERVSSACQNAVWEYKRSMTESPLFHLSSQNVCKEDFKNITECHSDQITNQQRIACFFEFKHRVKRGECRFFLNRIGTILFSDYHLIYNFAVKCEADVKRFKCGRLTGRLPGSGGEKTDLPSSQGRTIECLLDEINHLGKSCAHEIMRVTELQSDDFHLDRPLFFACRDDREKLCSDVSAGDGRVFKCLMKLAQSPRMSTDCKAHMTKRMALRQKSYKVDYSFAGACEADMKKLKCVPGDEVMAASRGGGIAGTSAISEVLLCLENAIKKQVHEVTPECLSEMFDIRRQLMSDFMITPEIVLLCKEPIETSCGNGLERNGKTVHCLMDLYKGKIGHPGLSEYPKCAGALKRLIKVADPGSDFRIDPVIGQACSGVIAGPCSSAPKHEGAVLRCLMHHMDANEMTEQCAEKLLELQYLLSRDFSLDPLLFQGCHQDAQRLCNAAPEWRNSKGTKSNKGALVFSCLYRAMQAREQYLEDEDDREDDDAVDKSVSVENKENLLSKTCAAEVLRVVRERSKRVMLNPFIYDNCMSDLARYCLQSTEGHHEMECLQKQYEKLNEDCREVVAKFTAEQERHPSLDRIMAMSCRPMITRFCTHEMNNDPGQIMTCLIRNKDHPEMNEKCRAGVEHHQIISLKDYHISHAFKRGCRKDLTKYCYGVKTKNDAVVCLSEVIRNNTLTDKEIPLTKSCMQQVRFENFQKSQDIRLSPRLAKSCSEDIRKHCAGVRKGKLIQCLRKQQWSRKLTKRCKQALFMRVQFESMDSRIDARLQRVCKTMIKHHCTGHEKDAIDCLWKHIHEFEFDGRCRRVVYLRLETRARDYRLDPLITHLCKHDIRKHCAALLDPRNNMTGGEYRGKVTGCLKEQYRLFKLSIGCKGHIRQLIVETNMNHHMDPILRRACEKDVQRVCATELEDSEGHDGDGAVTECLKKALSKAKLKSSECQKETMRLMEEGRADVHVDPVLYNACQSELGTLCHNTPLGNGRQMACLLWAKDDREARKGMSYHCRKQVQLRAEMWELAAKFTPPQSLGELAEQVTTSSAKNYFFAVLATMILAIFIFGLCCGRVTKRVRVDMKNK